MYIIRRGQAAICTFLTSIFSFMGRIIILYISIRYACTFVVMRLLEAAHWCIAGTQRRERLDYGYWYAPDGRSQEQQTLFEQVEVKPQAIEWLLSKSCGLPFRLSSDNLGADASPSKAFQLNVCHQAQAYCNGGLPPDAESLIAALRTEFKQKDALDPNHYTMENLSW